MDAYRVIRHPGDEDEGPQWTCGARQQRGPVEIASGPAPAVLRLGRTNQNYSDSREYTFLYFCPSTVWKNRVLSPVQLI